MYFWPLVSMKLCGFLFYSADMICVYAVGGFNLAIFAKFKSSPNFPIMWQPLVVNL